MPRKISEIKEFAPKKSLTNIQDDPSVNSVMGNVKKLYDVLAPYEKDIEVRALRDNLSTIMDSYSGKESEELGDSCLQTLFSPLHTVYLTKVKNNYSRIPDEKTRADVKNLIEYVAAGLDLQEERIPVTEDQLRNVKRREESGRKDRAWEKLDEAREARRQEFAGKTALSVLDEHKAKINKLPKSFRGADAKKNEAEARKQLKDICFDIMATRRSVQARRNDKSGLAKAEINADLLDSYKTDLSGNEVMNSFLDSMSYSDLRKLAAEGHGGAMEDKLASYVKTMPSIPGSTPQDYMPTALQRTEALQSMMDTQTFRKNSTPGEQRALYIELLAARAAVGSKRNEKNTLNVKINPSTLELERQNFKKEPLKTALARITSIEDRREFTLDAALKGHGGALEDRVRNEVRSMAVDKEFGYRLQPVDIRYAPTFDERRQDLRNLAGSNIPAADKLRAAVEIGALDMIQDIGYAGDSRIAKVEALNSQVDSIMKIYGRTMDAKDMKDFTKDVLDNGYEIAASNYETRHPGAVGAARKFNEIDEKLEANPSQEEVVKLAAQKMVLAEAYGTYQFNKTLDAAKNAAEAQAQGGGEHVSADEKLYGSISADSMNRKVSQLMKSATFKEMCDKLGPGKLLEQAKGDGLELIKSHSAALDGTLKEQPKAEAAKNGPDKDIKNEAPQAGGPRA